MELNIAGRVLSLSTGLFANQAHGAVVASLGDTQILATAVMSETSREGIDFFPLMVDYEERFYASGKIKGSRFIKREGRPSDNAVLTARLIDRPVRPLFPKNMTNDVQVIGTVLSADLEVDPGPIGIIAASAALLLSGMPFKGPVAAVRMGYVADSEGSKEIFVVNPTYEQARNGKLDLVVAGTLDAITMVEAAAKEVSEDILLEALEIAHKHIKTLCQLQLDLVKKLGVKTLEYLMREENPIARKAVEDTISEKKLKMPEGRRKLNSKRNCTRLRKNCLKNMQSKLKRKK